MSYRLAIWDGGRPVDDREAALVFRRLTSHPDPTRRPSDPIRRFLADLDSLETSKTARNGAPS